ncbi:MAG: tRNA (guanosine(37)-N1)-methyltransferase TrmD, partial [Clostridiales bacterium]|nr:tRNA (guanosine(37)-N1)-methyltransferase TrmD [Clostridiales bacterium]
VHADESIVTGLLEYPQYTRPRVFEWRAVPDVLLGGDHEEIRKWRLARAFERTLEKRPELLELLKGEEPLDRRDET